MWFDKDKIVDDWFEGNLPQPLFEKGEVKA